MADTPNVTAGADAGDLDAIVRSRLRGLRQALGLTLARALQIDLDSLLQGDATDTDVVIRPVASHRAGVTSWPLSRPTGSTVSVKMRIEPAVRRPEPRVHPGYDWFYVLEGRIRLTLGERTIVVEQGEAAEFSCMTPHVVDALDGPAEIIMIFDRDGQRAHLHHDG